MPALSRNLELLESRRYLTFTQADPSFGTGGYLQIQHYVTSPLEARVFALADGRVIAGSSGGLRFLRGSGHLDTKRAGGDGILPFPSQGTYGYDVDRAGGGIAVLFPVTANNNTDTVLQIYDSLGRLKVTKNVANRLDDYTNLKVRYAYDGTLILAGQQTNDLGNTTAAVLRLNPDGTEITSFSSDGFNRFVLNPGVSHPDSGAGLSDIGISPSRGLYMFFGRSDYRPTGDRTLKATQILRVKSNGQLDTTWGENGYLTIATGSNVSDASSGEVVIRGVVGVDGNLTVLTVRDRSSDYAGSSFNLDLRRFDPEGEEIGNLNVITTYGNSSPARTLSDARIAVERNGGVYLAFSPDATHAQVWHITPELEFNPAWGKFGPHAYTTIPFNAGTVDVTPTGQLLLAGASRNESGHNDGGIYAIKGVTESLAGVVEGRANLLLDGTLDIAGTGRTDTVDISRKNAIVTVKLNGRSQTFPAATVRGYLVHTGRGNDNVVVNANIQGAFVAAGDGNDVLSGSGFSDTLVGGNGNDVLTGNDSDDHIFGQAGADTIGRDGSPDSLSGGAGTDTLDLDSFSGENDNDDLLLDSTDDTVV
jgi:hypothetical protein